MQQLIWGITGTPPSKQPLPEVRPDSTKREQRSGSSASPPKEVSDDLITNSIGMQLKLLKRGTFQMGQGNQKHQVTLTEPFRLGIYAVTQEEYERVMNKNPSNFHGARRSVEGVSWLTAIEFCNRLSSGVSRFLRRFENNLPDI